jgi:alpha-glucosidase
MEIAAMTADVKPSQPVETCALISPSGKLVLQLSTDRDGRARYAVTLNANPVLSASALGFLFANAPSFDRGMLLYEVDRTHVDETWEQPWGEDRFIRNHYNELRVRLSEKSGQARAVVAVFRAFDDGIAFRYEFPNSALWSEIKISEELTEFNLCDAGTAWWIPAFGPSREEYLYYRTPINEVAIAQTPITLRSDSGVHVCLHEAALVDYSGMNLARTEARRFRAMLTPGCEGAAKVERQAPFATPWRTVQIAASAAELAMSCMTLNLNEPNALGDVSWVKPMKYIGIWWEMHVGRSTWAPGPKHGAHTENAKRQIDFAAQHGFDGVLVEGWNKGWENEWWTPGADKFSFSEPYPDFDIAAITAYGRSKAVALIGHHETLADTISYERQLSAALDFYAQHGVGAVKTGYVADAAQARLTGKDGKSTYGWHEGQAMVNHHHKVVIEAAKRKITVNPHEPVKDTGLRRTYPNLVTREGARGQEFNAWGNPGNPPEHETNLFFTRLLAAPMDFTPGIFGMKTGAPDGVATTWAKQLALYVVIYSPHQMAADLLEHYEANPAPFQFIKDVPVDWSETRVLNGEVGDYVTVVRKDRHSESWYLGAITDEHPRVLNIALAFLSRNQRYRAEIYRDGSDAHWKNNRESIVIEQRNLDSADQLTLSLAPGGGQAIRFVPLVDSATS